MYNYNLQVGARGPYCRLNIHVPLVRLYFDDGDLRKDFRLSRPTLDSLVHRLQGPVDHGWGKAFEVLLFLFRGLRHSPHDMPRCGPQGEQRHLANFQAADPLS